MGYGETLREVLLREVCEETGLEVNIGPVVHINHFIKEPFWVTCITFACHCDGGEVRLSEEHTDFAWVDLAQVSNRAYSRGTRRQLDAYRSFASGRVG